MREIGQFGRSLDQIVENIINFKSTVGVRTTFNINENLGFLVLVGLRNRNYYFYKVSLKN